MRNGTAFVGMPGAFDRHGRVVYELNAAGKFVFRSALTATDAREDDAFGTSVSVASGVIVIGAPGDRSLLSDATGAAYVFRRNSSGAWVQRQRHPAIIRESGGYVHTYARDGSIVTPVGLATGFSASNSLALANQWLLVGIPVTTECGGTAPCIGVADVFDLNRFTL
jgi:hypothetical protein